MGLSVPTLQASGGARRLVAFAVDADEADAVGDEPVWQDGNVVGWVMSGGYGHCTGRSIALGSTDSGFEIEILAERRPAQRIDRPLYDPEGARMRGIDQ